MICEVATPFARSLSLRAALALAHALMADLAAFEAEVVAARQAVDVPSRRITRWLERQS